MTLIYIGVFITTTFLIVLIYSVLFSKKVETKKRLKKYTEDEVSYSEIINNDNKKEEKSLLKLFKVLGKLMPKNTYSEKKKEKLAKAAVLIKPEEFFGASCISSILIAFLFYINTKSIFIAIVSMVLGFIIPDVILNIMINKRKAKINSQLPDALNIISNGLRAGFSFMQAISIVTNELSGPISEEFNKVIRDNSLGKPLEEALMNMSERTDDEDLDMVITTLIIQRQVGGNLAEVLDTIAYTIRERVKLKGDVKSLTAQGRLSGIIVSILPIALALVLSVINPGYLNPLFTTLIGKIAIIIGVLLQLIGIVILNKIINIKI